MSKPPLDLKELQARKAASKFTTAPVDTGLGDQLGPAEQQQPPEPRHEPTQTAKSVSAYEDAEGVIHAPAGSRKATDTPKNEIDYRAWRATGRNAPIHTKVRPEFRRMFYQGAAREEKELCVVLEEMILARYGRKK